MTKLTIQEYKEMLKRSKLNTKNRLKINSDDEAIELRSGRKPTKSSGGRGLSFEREIDLTNSYYLKQGKANIRKIPTPVRVLKLEQGRVVDGFYEKISALDFNGILKGGIHIDFDTKVTQNKTSFAFDDRKMHQIEYMESIHKLGGIAFYLINFKKNDSVYIMTYQNYLDYMNENPDTKSIKYSHFVNKLPNNEVKKIATTKGYVYDYMKVVEFIYGIKL